MGCRGSKTVLVREASTVAQPCSSTNNNTYAKDANQNNINVFVNIPADGDDQSLNICDNAKPRLTRSGIRRKPQDIIKPVINEQLSTEIDETPEYHIISSTSNSSNNALLADLSRASDSGFGNTSLLSPTTDRSKSSTANSPHKHRTKTPSFGIKRPDSVNRPDSGKTESILTTNALNASFMTTGENDLSFNVDVSLDLHTPFSEYTDMEDTTFRTLSITPSVRNLSVEPTPIMHTKHIGVIQEESEGGFTPRSNDFLSVQNSGLSLPQYLPREILSHNAQAGYRERTVYKGNVYDTNLIISRFEPIVEEYLENKMQERVKFKNNQEMTRKQNRYNNEDDSDGSSLEEESFDKEDDDYFTNEQCIRFGNEFWNRQKWSLLGMNALLRLKLESDVIRSNLIPCCVGEVAQPYSTRYWDDVRGDVRMVLDYLNRCDANDELSVNESELKDQFQGWMQQYYDHNPPVATDKPKGDPNESAFPLPSRIQEDPNALRLWMERWIEFDLEVPDSGAWKRFEIDDVDDVDLGDSDDIFKATLRAGADLGNPFDVDIDGEVAWCVIPTDVVADDIMTPEQQLVQDSRRYRTDLHDPKRMERRRHTLLNYFKRKYEMRVSDVEHFNIWASTMEEGDRQLQELCGTI